MHKVNVEEYAQRLTKPFLVMGLALVDNYLVSVYSCHGAMSWHRHLDEDELFMGYSGTGMIETAWGRASLGFTEILTVPKGLPHRSLSVMPAHLLLVQTRGLPERRNGHQQVYVGREGRIEKVSVAQEAARLNDVYLPRRIAMSDALGVSVQICLGAQQWHRHQGDQLIFCQYGQLTVECEDTSEVVSRGEFAVISAGERHRVSAVEPATAVVMARVEQ
ncbi:MAG: cupin domain-containing protein [Anaerolineae bacterium]